MEASDLIPGTPLPCLRGNTEHSGLLQPAGELSPLIYPPQQLTQYERTDFSGERTGSDTVISRLFSGVDFGPVYFLTPLDGLAEKESLGLFS